MRFTLIDRITQLTDGESITAIKALSLAEEYLQDHFPRFPVMPGVLMLEAMYQAAAWLVRRTDQFAYSVVLLKQAKSVTFRDFVSPGQLLTVRATIVAQEGNTVTLKTKGEVDGQAAANARLILERFNLADRAPERAASDNWARLELRRVFDQLYRD